MKKLLATDTGKGKLFEKSGLDALSRTPVWLSILVYTSIWVLLLFIHYQFGKSGLGASLIIYFSAMFFWTLFEYVAHRFLFHWVNESPRVQRFHYMIHGIHHEFPRDEERLIMPVVPGFVLIFVLTGLFSLVFGPDTFIWMAGFINGWAIYVSIHYMVHAYQPTKAFKILWTHHAKHHYKDGNKAYGVSSPFWDYIFRTMPD